MVGESPILVLPCPGWEEGKMEIYTSCPRSFKKRKSLSKEKSAKKPRIRSEIFGWLIFKIFAALACVSFFLSHRFVFRVKKSQAKEIDIL